MNSLPNLSNRISRMSTKQSGVRWANSPTVQAMIKGNNMRSCSDISDMYVQCQETNAEDSICKTAEQYFAKCMACNEQRQS
jgi:hypothetical protein